MNKLLIISPDFPPERGGIQVMMYRLATLMPAFDVSVVTRGGSDLAEFRGKVDLPVHRSSRSRSRVLDLGLLNAAALATAARERPAAVLVGHIVASPSAAAWRWITDAPVCLCLHADEVVRRGRLAAFAIHHSDACVAVSRHTGELALARGAKPEQLRLISPGVDLPTRRSATRASRPTILTVGRLQDRFKGHDMLIRALARIRECVPDVEWIVVGDGTLRAELEAAVIQLGLRGHVRFMGEVSDCVRDEWLDRAHVFAMPSRLPPGRGGEGFGIAFLEASAHGLPVVAGRAAGALDAVVDKQTGLLVDPTSVDDLAGALVTLLTDADLAEKLGRAGAYRAESFSWERTAAQVQDALLEMIDTAQAHAPASPALGGAR